MSIETYLQTLKVGDRTRSDYRDVLRSFDQNVFKKITSKKQLIELLKQWIRARRQGKLSLYRVLHRGFIIHRFAKWMSHRGDSRGTTVIALCSEYGGALTPIFRALNDTESKRSLETLRTLPPFGSFLGPSMKGCIQRMRDLGYRFNTAEQGLLQFDRFLQIHPKLRNKCPAQLIEAWQREKETPARRLHAQKCGRVLTKYLHRLNPSIAVIEIDKDLNRQIIRRARKPYVYSEDEISRLLKTAQSLPSKTAPLRPKTMYTIFVLAYCTGMRIGEIVRLTVGNINLDQGILDVMDSKFFKSRRLPLSTTVLSTLKSYLEERKKAGAPDKPEAGLLWSDVRNKPYAFQSIHQLMLTVLRRAKLKPTKGKQGPRIHDLRHSFAVNRLTQWYREGVDPQAQLAQLSTYLGHKDIQSTAIYLHLTPELMGLISERFRQYVLQQTHKT